MKWLLFGSVTGLLAAATPPAESIIGQYGQLGAVAALSATIIILVYRTIPKMSENFAKTLTTISDRQHADSEKLTETLTELRVHCASKEKGD